MFKKILLGILACVSPLLASDELSIDSLFKKQIGLRSITNVSLLSSGNANSYTMYPNLSITGDPTIWNDTKQLSLNQTFIYTLHPKFDLLVSGNGSYARQEYTNFFTGEYSHNNKWSFNSLWLGLIYTFNSVADLCHRLAFKVQWCRGRLSSMRIKTSTSNLKTCKQL